MGCEKISWAPAFTVYSMGCEKISWAPAFTVYSLGCEKIIWAPAFSLPVSGARRTRSSSVVLVVCIYLTGKTPHSSLRGEDERT
jgi:hypothetical protein